jgi:hypothetical protein
MHPLAPHSLPIFISSPAGPDYLMIGVAIFLVAFVLAIGLLYLRLDALPNQIAHKSKKVQYEIVCVLGLLAMFTHIHAFWVAGLLIALIDFPDFSTPLRRISGALEKIAAGRQPPRFSTPLKRISGALDRIAAGRQRQLVVSGLDGSTPRNGTEAHLETRATLPPPSLLPSRASNQPPPDDCLTRAEAPPDRPALRKTPSRSHANAVRTAGSS